jgi:glycosyltransferase involved in cell wall biosynthesis
MKRNICITVDYFPVQGGAQSIINEICKVLEQKYEIHMLAITPPLFTSPYKIHKISTWRRGGRGLWCSPFFFPFNLLYILAGLLNLLNLNKKYQFKYVFPQDGVFTAFYSAIFSKLTGVKSIIMDYGVTTNYLSDTYWESAKRYRKHPRLFALENFILRKLALIAMKISARVSMALMVTGQELEVIYRHVLKVPSEKLRKYVYCVDTDKFKPLSEEEVLKERKKFGIPEKSILVGSVSRLAPEKGLEYLLPALKRAVKEIGKIKVLIVGGGPLYDYVRSFIQENSLENDILILGEVDRNEVHKIFQILDIFIYAGISGSNVSLAVLEAMSSGCAVIATNSPRYHEELLDGKNGFVIPTKDSDSIYLALKRLCENPHLLKAVKAKARETILKRHSIEAMRDCLKDL